MRRGFALVAAGAAAVVGCGGGTAAGTRSSSSAAPALDALIARASGLKIDSMDAALRTSVPGSATVAGQTLVGTISMRLRPQIVGSFHFTVAGQAVDERIVGGSAYIEVPTIAAHDGGRPWVAIRLGAVSSASGIDVAELLDEARNADPTTTLRLLAARRDFRQTGTATIRGQAAVVLSGSFDPATLTSTRLSPALVAEIKAKLAQLGATREAVTVYLARSTGVPLRTLTVVQLGRGSVTSTVDVLDVNRPVSVAAPPANQTITLTELEQLGLRS